MRKFKFNLQKILELKKFNEEECKMALGYAIGILNEIENKIKETAVKKHNAATERFNDPSQIIMWNNYITRLDQEAEILMEKAALAQNVVEEKRELYMEAFKELTAMEKLKEKQEKEYKKEMGKRYDNEIDELFAARSIRNGINV
ncbi:MAG: flagellar export protein FliJ [Treponema sp.]|nr:flagellar export protein FliJ [Treponema sp.]